MAVKLEFGKVVQLLGLEVRRFTLGLQSCSSVTPSQATGQPLSATAFLFCIETYTLRHVGSPFKLRDWFVKGADSVSISLARLTF